MTSLLTEPVTMTLEAFLQFSEQQDDGNHYELDEGELITLSPVGYLHGRRVIEINADLRQRLDRNVYDVIGGEAGIIMALDPKATVRGMDVAVLYRPEKRPQGMLREAPLLIVEVISPSNTSIYMERKRRQYQAFGVAEVWFVYEETQSIHIYRRDKPEFLICEPPGVFEASIGLHIESKELFL